jgi:hypothetical protein
MASMIELKTAARSLRAVPDRRNETRLDAAIWSHLRTRDRRTYPARITNISPGGLKLLTPAKLIDYAEIEVELPRIGWKYLLTVWANGDEIGAEFEPMLSPETVAQVLEYHSRTH